MAPHLFPNFLSDKSQYDQAKEYWKQLCAAAVPPSERKQWSEWLADEDFAYHDGESVRVFSWLNEKENKGICVQQLGPSKKKEKIGARMDVFGAGHLNRPIEFIYIWCELTEETAETAKKIVSKWSRPTVTSSDMSRIAKEILKS